MTLLADLRKKNPRLADYSDQQLAGALRQQPQFRYLDDQEFQNHIGLAAADSSEAPGFVSGVAAGVDQLQATGGGLMMVAGEKLGSEGLWDAGRGVYQSNMDEAAENALGYGFTDLFGDPETSAWQWAAYTAGNVLPSIALAVGTGGAGGIAARTIVGAVAKQAATRAGQAIGSYAASAGMETGAIMGEVENADVALAHGSIAGALDALPIMRVLRKVGGQKVADQAAADIANSTLSKLRQTASQGMTGAGARGGATQLLTESSTEGLQSLIEQNASYWVENNSETLLTNLGEANWKQVIDATAAGGLAGGIMGAPAGVVERSRAKSEVARYTTQQAQQQRKDEAIAEARRQTQAAGGDPLAQTQAAQQAEQMAEASTQQEQDAATPQRSAEIGNRIQIAMTQADEMTRLAQGSNEGQTRLRNMQGVLSRAEAAYEKGNLEQAERLMVRAEQIGSSLNSNLQREGSRERPLSGQLAETEQGITGLLGQDSAPRLSAPDPSVINMGGTTAEATQYEPQARNVRRDEGMAAQRQGSQRLREDMAAQRPLLADQDIVYVEGETPRRGNANTGMDHPFMSGQFSDTGARDGQEESRAQQQRSAQRVAKLARTRGLRETTYLPDNTPVNTLYRVVELADLTPSNMPDGRVNPRYPAELQPRDRTNANSHVQVRNIAANLNPERLGRSSDAATGAPIIGQDGVVESGNGRTMAIAQTYQQGGNQAQRYRQYVVQQAEAIGMDPSAVDAMDQPVLVRERSGNIDRAEFSRRANESTVAGMTSYEQARADAESLSSDDLARWTPDQSGDPLAASNRAFQRAFVSRLGNNEASRYTTRGGQASPELGQRMQRAVFAKAYADSDMVEMATEQSDTMRNLTAAMQVAAPDLAVARETGSQEALDAINTINDAVRIIRQARQDGISVRELTRQADAFSDPAPETTVLLAVAMHNNMRNRRALSEAMRYIGQAVRQRAEGEQNGTLFEDTTTNEDVINAAFQDQSQRPEQRPFEGDVQPGAERGQRQSTEGREVDSTQRLQEEGAVDDEPLLRSYTEQDISDREQAQTAQEQADADQRNQEAQRAQVDADRNDFSLSGSDRTADTAAAQGQQDLGVSEDVFYEREESNIPRGQRDDGIVRERKRSSAQSFGQLDLLSAAALPVAPSSASPSVKDGTKNTAKAQVADNFRLRYEFTDSGSVMVGLDTVNSPEDVAHVVAPFRKNAQEQMLVLVTNDDGKILQLVRHASGGRDSSQVFVDELVTSAAMVPGATKIWLSHNHPSGSIDPSDADYNITESIRSALDASGISLQGHVIGAAGGKFTYFNNRESRRSVTPTKVNRKRSIGIGQKVLRKRAPSDFAAIGSPDDAKRLVNNMQMDNGILLLDTKNVPIGVLAMTDSEMETLREDGRARRILEALGSTNAGSLMVISETTIAAYNVISFINNLGSVRPLDAFVGDPGSRRSRAKDGSINQLGSIFFSLNKGRYPDTTQSAGATQVTADNARMALNDYAQMLGDFTVVDRVSDLPQRLVDNMAAQGVSPRDVKGIYDGDTLYIIAANNDGIEQVVRTAVHEAVGHKGIRGVLGDELTPVMRSLYKNLPLSKQGREALSEVLENYKHLDRNNPDDQLAIAEEMVAHLLEKGYRPKAWHRAVAKIRTLLRQLFPTVNWTYTDVLALGEQSRAYLAKQQAQQQAQQGDTATRYSQKATSGVDKITLFHGGGESLTEILGDTKPGNIFGGIFASDSEMAADSHGDTLYEVQIDEDGLLTQSALDYDLDPDSVAEALRSAMPRLSDEDFDTAYMAVVEDKSYEIDSDELMRIFHEPSVGDAIWDAQRVRGVVAGKLGYQAVEMDDEHGTSYLVLPGATVNPDIRYSLAGKQRIPVSRHFDDMDPVMSAAFDKIGPETMKAGAFRWFREHADQAGTKIRQGMADHVAALLRLDIAAANDKDVVQNSTASSSWVLARMANSANGALNAMLHNGRVYLDPKEKVIDIKDGDSKGLGSVLGRLGSAGEIERFMGWVAGNRSAALAAEGRENLFSGEEIAALKRANQGQTDTGQDRAQLYDDVFAEFQQYRDDVLAIAEQSGIISAENRAMWRDEFYVPFYRINNEDRAAQGPIATSGLTRQQAFKKLKGGSQNLNDLLQNTMLNFHHLMEASLKNQAAMQAVDNAVTVGIGRVVPESDRNTVDSTFVMREGKKVFYEIDDPLVFKAITSLAHPGMNSTAMSVMRKFKRLFTNLTTITPQFMVANLIRDSLQASATSQVSKNPLANIVTGGRTLKDARTNARMMASGASFNFGHLYGNNPDELRAQLTRNLRDAHIINSPTAIPDAVRSLWAGWGDVNNFAENMNRAAIYKENLDGGKGKLYAAYESRDLIDFSAHGAWPAVRILIDIVPFLNARIQGLDKIYRSGIKPGANVLLAAFGKGEAGVSDKEAAARFWMVTGALATATMALYVHNYDDEEYQKLEAWQKDTYWFFRVGDQAIFIPKPFEVGAIATLTERMLEQAMDDKATGKLFAQRVGHMVTDTFSFSPVPQAFQPVLNIYANKDDFTGRPIEGMGMDRLSPELRRRSSTSAVAQGASNILNSTVGAIGYPDANPLALSPLQVDHLIQGYFGQVGAWATAVTDVGWKTLNGKSSPAQHWYEYQPIRRFYENLGDEDRYTKYGTLFYEGLREAQRAYSDVKQMREMGELEAAMEVADSKREMLRLRPALNRAQSSLRKINQKMDMVRRSNLTSEVKRQRMDRLRAVKNRIQKALGIRVQEARIAG